MERGTPLELRHVPSLFLLSLTAGACKVLCTPSQPAKADADFLKRELVAQVLASLSSAGEAELRDPPLTSIESFHASPSPSQPSSPEAVTFYTPQLLFRHFTLCSSKQRERSSAARSLREQSLWTDEERRVEEKRERRREKDRARKRVQREKQRREKAIQARSRNLNGMPEGSPLFL